MSASATLTLRLPIEIKAKLERLAAATERSKSWLALDALRSYVELQEWQICEIEKGLVEAEAGEFVSDQEVEGFFAQWAKEG